jgi:hypothetical protein
LENAFVHPVGNVEMLSQHITLLHQDRVLLHRLRVTTLKTVPETTWTAAGAKLFGAYRQALADRHGTKSVVCPNANL